MPDRITVRRARHGDSRATSPVALAPLALAITLTALWLVAAPRASAATDAHGRTVTLTGRVRSGSIPIGSAPITLDRAGRTPGGAPVVLASGRTRSDGTFRLTYRRPRGGAVLYVLARRGRAVRLAAVLGGTSAPTRIVVNERTTVAMGFALAQFISARGVAGNAPGPQNAAAMASDLVTAGTGRPGTVLTSPPNGLQTSTLQTFGSLANLLVACARSHARCRRLFALAAQPGRPAPRGTLTAIADIARDPSHDVGSLSALARRVHVYRPALPSSARPDAWLLALRFDGNGHTLDGPGNMAIDARGNVWATSNYTYSPDPQAAVCGSGLLFKFTPTGRFVDGSPYSGGGLSGAGFGITLDPRGHVWVGDFGFASTACPDQPPHNAISEFDSDGRTLTPGRSSTSTGGFTAGDISWPQGTISDRFGNIWIANCGNDSVTRYPGGKPRAAVNYTGLGIAKPFDAALNRRNQLFVTGNGSNSVAILNPNGTLARAPISGAGIDAPIGIAADSEGNMWVANSGVISIPCPSGGLRPSGTSSVTLINSNGTARPAPFTGGGIDWPWGIAVDGNDNVWVANFNGQRVSELCGVKTASCPPGTHTGQAISPSRTGYGFDGLLRNTGIQIDPSGNVWVANNWQLNPNEHANPGGFQLVALIGVAGPLKTPLIGPPVSLEVR